MLDLSPFSSLGGTSGSAAKGVVRCATACTQAVPHTGCARSPDRGTLVTWRGRETAPKQSGALCPVSHGMCPVSHGMCPVS